jgi:signal transduction histidine kinase/CheY-like chemotaxis protein
MTLHRLLPLIALILNLCLVAISLLRNPQSRLNRIFAYFVSTLALWNFGVFMLRGARDPTTAYQWEILIHVGVIALPAFYYHFVLIFLDSTVRQRRWLVAAYGLSAVFSLLNLLASSVFMTGVQSTAWGWAPAPGRLYNVFFVYFYAFLLAGLVHLGHAYKSADSGFRRNRTLLILVGAVLTIFGGFVDVVRFALAKPFPLVDRIYPIGIPANMVCALMFGTAIIRYRMFDVSAVVKKCAVYGTVGAAVTSILVALTWVLERTFELENMTAVWMIAPLGFIFTLLLTPLGRPIEDWIERLMFSKSRGCHETLVALSKQMSTMLDFGKVVDTLVRDLVRGIPLTHSALLIYDETTRSFVTQREETTTGESAGVAAMRGDSLIVQWLRRKEGVLVKEEAVLNRRAAQYFDAAGEELEDIKASLIVPLKLESEITGILLLGEKLSGEIFDTEELELLGVLANQAAIAMANARLYEQADRERRRIEVLYQLSRRLATATETQELLSLIVKETSQLLGVEVAALRLLEEEELVLKAWTHSPIASALRPRLRIGESLTGIVVATNQPLTVEDVLEDERYDPLHKKAVEAIGLHGFLGVPLRADGKPTGVLYVYTQQRRRFAADDISLLSAFADQASVILEKGRLAEERKQAEEALRQSEKLATMGQLLAGVAHELNNPLTVLIGYAGMLRSGAESRSQKLRGRSVDYAAEQIETAAEHCSRIVQNFLALARKHPPERRRVALNQIVTGAGELLAYPLATDNVKVNLDLAADLPDLWADQHQLQQVVVNLLTNAHHALRQTSGRHLTITTRYDPARSCVGLWVADTGPGIPPELLARIFEPFFTTKPIGEGTGLGLSLCQGIVESHGGSIRVETEVGRGAVFKIELPVGSVRLEPPGPDAGSGFPIPQRKVLVVDDDSAVATLLADLLTLDGHQVETASNAATALERLADRSYDLVISDIRMPKLDGPGLYREVERRHGGRRPLFVFITGDILGADTLKFLEKTKVPCLNKPFAREDVRRAVHSALAAAQ